MAEFNRKYGGHIGFAAHAHWKGKGTGGGRVRGRGAAGWGERPVLSAARDPGRPPAFPPPPRPQRPLLRASVMP